jgi:peptidoglycan/LPS O-acetylase OafA/YrhL
MRYQPGLDGLRALSVIAVIFYHAGFGWSSGGFFGVEVFFVVSGYLITSLLIGEHAGSGTVSLRGFWGRRARRLLPALVAMMLAVGVWAAVWGSAQQQSDLRRDFPWAILYAANWGQIVGEVPYFSGGDPALLRHLWSLAVEEQWYVLWPLAFMGLAALRVSRRAKGTGLVVVSLAVMVLTWWLARMPELSSARTNLLYLSTLTRSSGLLLGAGIALWWRPWEREVESSSGRERSASRDGSAGSEGRWFDAALVMSIAVLGVMFAIGHVDDRATYRWMLPVVTIASAVAVVSTVHPESWVSRRLLASVAATVVGRRSYGLYLWTWPISVMVGATTGSVSAFVVAMAISVPVSEACYRFVETPIRTGQWRVISSAALNSAATACSLLGVALFAFYGDVEPYDPAKGGGDVAFVAPALSATASAQAAAPSDSTSTAGPSSLPATSATSGTSGTSGTSSTLSNPSTTLPSLPRRVVIVGDSQAHSLAINLPDGVEQTFTISDGSTDGCGVFEEGSVVSARSSFRRSFGDCAGVAETWAAAAADADAEVALVVLGAWEVFDLRVDQLDVPFASAEFDRRVLEQLAGGIDALRTTGARVAVLEVPCMRPQDVDGAGVPALPERGDDERVAHLNGLFRQAVAASPEGVQFVEGPDEWCANPAIASDLAYRWDGVHVYTPGAALIYQTVAPALLQM